MSKKGKRKKKKEKKQPMMLALPDGNVFGFANFQAMIMNEIR